MADVGGVKEKRSKKGKKKGAAESSAEKAESQIATEKQCMEDSKLEGKPLEVERGEPVDDTQQDGMESASEQKGAERGKSQAASGDGGEKEEGSTARAAEEEFPHTPAPSIAPSADATSSAEQVGGIVQDGEAGNKAGEKEESCDSQPAVEAASTDSHGKILREDEDCFLADYTKPTPPGGSSMQLTMLIEPVRAWIARELVELDEDVSLAIRCGPGKDQEEVGVLSAGEEVIVVGKKGSWALLAGEPARWVLAYSDGEPLLRVRPAKVTAETARKLVGNLASSAWRIFNEYKEPAALVCEDLDAQTSEKGDAQQDREPPAQAQTLAEAQGSWGAGWGGLGGWMKTISTGASSVAANIMKAGGEEYGEHPTTGLEGGVKMEGGEGTGGKEGNMSVQEGEDEEGGKDSPKGFSDSITKGIDERFKEDIKISEGGFSSVRYVEKGISMFESSLGWLGTTASASINHQRVDAFVDQAWSGVREGVQVSQQSFSHAQAAATQAAQHTASGLKDHLTKGKKILQDTIIIASRPKTEAQRPNLKLGGALGIQLSGALMPRIPTPDEDVDPLFQEKLENLKPLPFAIKGIAALVHERFQEDVFLFAVASAGVQARMLRWLGLHNVYKETGLSRDRVHLCRDEEEQRDLCRELGLTHVIEVSETGAVTLREAVGDVLVLGDGGVLTLLEGGTDADFVEKHTQIFEAWWGAAIEHLLPITPEAPKEISEDSAESDVLTVQEPAKV